MHNIVEVAHSMHKKCIITNIETDANYRKALALKADGLEGSYVAERVSTRVHSSAYLHSSFFRVMVAITKDEPDVDEIESLISMDASLTYNLLKVANSAYFAVRNRVTTVHQAIMTLGLVQLKQWIFLLSASSGTESAEAATEEFLKRSFMRASFCSELMQYAKDMPISKAEGYLMGMFSTLNHLVDAPLEEILEELPVSDVVREALLKKEGRCGQLYDLVLRYEAADWDAISTLAEELGIPNRLLTNIYFNCMETVNALWEQLSNASAGIGPEEAPPEPEAEPES